jgi:hypothetical protein
MECGLVSDGGHSEVHVDGVIKAPAIVEYTTAHSEDFFRSLKMCSKCKHKSVKLGIGVSLGGFQCVENFWYILSSSSGS